MLKVLLKVSSAQLTLCSWWKAVPKNWTVPPRFRVYVNVIDGKVNWQNLKSKSLNCNPVNNI